MATANPLQLSRPTPEVGYSLQEQRFESQEAARIINLLAPRYVFSPGQDIDLRGQLVSIKDYYIYRGRLAYVQPLPYFRRDESDSAMMAISERDAQGLVQDTKTTFDQCFHMYETYSDRGFYVMEHLTGVARADVSLIERTILPTVPPTLLKTIEYLREQSERNIQDSFELSERPALQEKAYETLHHMLKACDKALSYQMEYLDTTETELLARRNGGVGKGFLDNVDKLYYAMCERLEPREKDLDFTKQKESADSQLIKQLAEALAANQKTTEAPKVDENEVSRLKAEMAELKQLLTAALKRDSSAAEELTLNIKPADAKPKATK